MTAETKIKFNFFSTIILIVIKTPIFNALRSSYTKRRARDVKQRLDEGGKRRGGERCIMMKVIESNKKLWEIYDQYKVEFEFNCMWLFEFDKTRNLAWLITFTIVETYHSQ